MSETNLLDTDTIIYWLKNKFPAINQKIESINSDFIFISSINVAELYFGAYNSSKKEENVFVIDELLKDVNLIDFDEKAGKYFGDIKAGLKKQGKLIMDSDLFIAAIAMSNNAMSNNFTLISNNEKHFKRIEKLKIENWTK
ncbi:MAG: type II toxin-antitoxin system VapC family toxin [bacterium]|nr:type II toxin-antitoxin system VapC family toxin [bacterium]